MFGGRERIEFLKLALPPRTWGLQPPSCGGLTHLPQPSPTSVQGVDPLHLSSAHIMDLQELDTRG